MVTYISDDADSLALDVLIIDVIVRGMREQSLELVESLNVGPLPPAKTPNAENKYVASLLKLLTTTAHTYGPFA